MKFKPEELTIILLENPRTHIRILKDMYPRSDRQITVLPNGFRIDFGYGKFEENQYSLTFKFEDYGNTWLFEEEDEEKFVKKYNIRLTEINTELGKPIPALRSWNGNWLALAGEKLWDYEELDNKLEYPSDLLLRIILDQYVEVENEKGEMISKLVTIKYNRIWIKHKGKECFLPYEDFQKTWWLRED